MMTGRFNITVYNNYQTDITNVIDYNDDYYKKVKDKTNKKLINAIRKDIVDKHSPSGMVLDMGCGDGSFLDLMKVGFGHDIMPKAVEWLNDRNMYINPYIKIPEDVTTITMWDSLEHLPEPKIFLSKITTQTLFVAMPIVTDMRRIRQFCHYRPNEHLIYFTHNGFMDWMKKQGFYCVDNNDLETKAGRREIETFVFRRL